MKKQDQIVQCLINGGVVVMPTDTIFGLLGRAEDEKVVGRIYEIKGRKPEKPLIILISDIRDLKRFDVKIAQSQREALDRYWPGPVSIILPCSESKLTYLTRGTETLAFRLPGDRDLVDLIRETGPLVAPSANPEDLVPAANDKEARDYFGAKVDLYIEGQKIGKPSKLIDLTGESPIILRH